MEVRGSRTSTVIVHRVAPGNADRFMEWQRGITQAMTSFAGYEGTEIYPPADRRNEEWVVVFHFDDPQSLQRWIDSAVRSEWPSKLTREIGDFSLKTLAAGFNPWFAWQVPGSADELPPGWKM